MPKDKTPQSNLEKANSLVKAVGKEFGVRNAKLDANGDCSLGDCGFSLDDTKGTLSARIFIGKAFSPNALPEGIENTKKCYAALDDPDIGGLFEHGGGHFVVDENKNMVFLVKDYDLDSVSADEFKSDVEYLLSLGATWSLKWLTRVAEIVHGWEPPPEEPVTLESESERE